MPSSITSWIAMLVGALALLFTIFSFWWMNWRPGKLNAGSIRIFAAGKGVEGNADEKYLVIVSLPLVLWNSGARSLLIEDLRLVPRGCPSMPELRFEAVDDKLTTSTLETAERINRDYYFLPATLKANEIVRANCVFEARSQEFHFAAARYFLQLQARLSGSPKWRYIRQLELNFSGLDNMELYNLNEFYSVFPYRTNEGA